MITRRQETGAEVFRILYIRMVFRLASQNFFIYLALLLKEKGRRHAKLALTTPLLFPP